MSNSDLQKEKEKRCAANRGEIDGGVGVEIGLDSGGGEGERVAKDSVAAEQRREKLWWLMMWHGQMV